jgi:hypothetical protein
MYARAVASEPVNLVQLRDARNTARDRLAAAYAEDLIDGDELDRRLDDLVEASTLEEIGALTCDVVVPETSLAVGEQAPTSLARIEDVPLTSTISAVLGEAQRRGVWVPARFNTVRSILASAEIDLREATLTPGETVFDVTVVFGELVFIVPPGLRVLSDVSIILASLEDDDDRTPQYGPAVVRITGHVVMGEVEISRRLPGESKRDARRRRKAERKQLKQAARQRALPPGS